MNLRKANILGSCILILTCGTLAVQVVNIKSGVSVDYLGPRFFPGLILAMIAALSVLVIGITWKSKEGTDTAFASKSGLIYSIITLTVFIAYAIGLGIFGYAIATALFLFVLSSFFYGKIDKHLMIIAIYAVVSTAAIYALFTFVFHVRLPGGML